MKKTLLLFMVMISLSSMSQNLLQESFQTYNSNVQLSGQGNWTNNSSLPGGLGSCTGFGCANALVVDRTVASNGYGSSAKAFSLTPDTDGCGKSFTPFTENGDLYVGMVINVTTAQASPIDFFRVQSGNNLTTTFRVLVQPTSGSTYSIGIRKGETTNPTVYTTNSYNYNTDYLLIFKYSQLPGTNDDTITLYANANYGAGEAGNTVSATNFAGTDQSGNIDRMSFRQNAGPAGLPTGFVGLISVAKTWETLTFNLENQQFMSDSFSVSVKNISKGLLQIDAESDLDNGTLNIYDISGKKLVSKSIRLERSLNDVTINPITNNGVYIVEIISGNQKFVKKVLVD